jgi:hypothetical protein
MGQRITTPETRETHKIASALQFLIAEFNLLQPLNSFGFQALCVFVAGFAPAASRLNGYPPPGSSCASRSMTQAPPACKA